MNWIEFFSYVVVTAITPGPNTLMSMSNAGRLGFRKAFPFNLGIWAGFSVVALLCTAFCRLLSVLLPKLHTPMLILGAAYMLWLAWKIWKSTGVENKDAQSGTFVSGLILQFVNPKIYLYCIVSMEAYILPHYTSWGVLAAFALLLAFIGFLFTLVWAGFGSVLRVVFSRHAKLTNGIMAVLLVYCAVSLFR